MFGVDWVLRDLPNYRYNLLVGYYGENMHVFIMAQNQKITKQRIGGGGGLERLTRSLIVSHFYLLADFTELQKIMKNNYKNV